MNQPKPELMVPILTSPDEATRGIFRVAAPCVGGTAAQFQFLDPPTAGWNPRSEAGCHPTTLAIGRVLHRYLDPHVLTWLYFPPPTLEEAVEKLKNAPASLTAAEKQLLLEKLR